MCIEKKLYKKPSSLGMRIRHGVIMRLPAEFYIYKLLLNINYI
jgi:hypothetical protein